MQKMLGGAQALAGFELRGRIGVGLGVRPSLKAVSDLGPIE